MLEAQISEGERNNFIHKLILSYSQGWMGPSGIRLISRSAGGFGAGALVPGADGPTGLPDNFPVSRWSWRRFARTFFCRHTQNRCYCEITSPCRFKKQTARAGLACPVRPWGQTNLKGGLGPPWPPPGYTPEIQSRLNVHGSPRIQGALYNITSILKKL